MSSDRQMKLFEFTRYAGRCRLLVRLLQLPRYNLSYCLMHVQACRSFVDQAREYEQNSAYEDKYSWRKCVA